jgi:serine/threonine protein kinase
MAYPEHKSLRRLFELIYEAPAAERDAILDRECGNDTQLKQRLRTMVRAAEEDSFLDEPTPDAPPIPRLEDVVTVDPERPEQPSQVIDRYKMLQQIGEGGFGVVYMAEQQKSRSAGSVALKIIKLGMDTKQVIARFEAERQALAMMDHPNIARCSTPGPPRPAGPTSSWNSSAASRSPSTATARKRPLRPSGCAVHAGLQRVQHAHQKGIIHRDIKPTNVLITLHDGKPVPKVIDFGIAKATKQRLTEKTLFTELRAVPRHAEYMSPEQAEMSGSTSTPGATSTRSVSCSTSC